MKSEERQLGGSMFEFTATVERQAAGCFWPSRRSPTGSHQELAPGQLDAELGPLGPAPASTLHVSNVGCACEAVCVCACAVNMINSQPAPPPPRDLDSRRVSSFFFKTERKTRISIRFFSFFFPFFWRRGGV